MRVMIGAALCAALSLGACASPARMIEAVEVLNDGCDKTVEATVTYVAPMPPTGTVKVTKTCFADKRRALSAETPAASP